MNTFTNISHAAQRQAFSVLIDKFLGHLDKTDDRTKTYLKLVDEAERFWGKKAADPEKLEAVRRAFKDPDNRWVNFINRVLDETDPHVAKMTMLNLGGTRLSSGEQGLYGRTGKNMAVTYRGLYFLILLLPAICTVKDAGQALMDQRTICLLPIWIR